METLLDITGKQVEVGDVITVSRYSYLSNHIVLGLPTKYRSTFILSCSKDTYYSNMYIVNQKDVSLHNSKQYKCVGDFVILEKNVKIPEQLRKFVRTN